jgi:hypothetical protein
MSYGTHKNHLSGLSDQEIELMIFHEKERRAFRDISTEELKGWRE